MELALKKGGAGGDNKEKRKSLRGKFSKFKGLQGCHSIFGCWKQ